MDHETIKLFFHSFILLKIYVNSQDSVNCIVFILYELDNLCNRGSWICEKAKFSANGCVRSVLTFILHICQMLEKVHALLKMLQNMSFKPRRYSPCTNRLFWEYLLSLFVINNSFMQSVLIMAIELQNVTPEDKITFKKQTREILKELQHLKVTSCESSTFNVF